MMTYAAIAVEGGLLPADLLERIAGGEAKGQDANDFRLDGVRLSDEIQGAFSDARAFWDVFQRRLSRPRESITSITRDAWVIPLLERLDYGLDYQRAAAQAGGNSYLISHRAGGGASAPPIHIVPVDQPLDRRDGTRRSPHALVQEYLNRSDSLWGMVTNGERLRVLRDSARISRPTYIDLDLRAMIEGNLYSEFVLFYRLLHRSRLPHEGANANECLLEEYYQQGIDEGGRVREHLRTGVEAALQELGTAFLAHPRSGVLREALGNGRLTAETYYRQLLRLVYRLLFLFAAEERRLIFPPGGERAGRQEIYARYYSLTLLRARCERPFAEDRYSDLWPGLLQTFRIFRNQDLAQALGMAALNGELFGERACLDLEPAGCDNRRLLRAIYQLSTFQDGRVRRRVNYAALDVEELGSVYESLLDYRPHVEGIGGRVSGVGPSPAAPHLTPRFELVAGGERKQTGSYYTPPSLVHELIESALVPVVEERLATAKTAEDKEQALLDLRVCDPASGSGHFLLAAARRIARELAKARSGEEEPAPEGYRIALRDVIRSCIYAVDKNPLAVDLCKVALWIEGHNAGLPLSFLDNHIKSGDSLIGVFDFAVLERGIPDDAYTAVTGDDKQIASALKKRNKAECAGQLSLNLPAVLGGTEAFAGEFGVLNELTERTPADVHAKEEIYASLRGPTTDWWTLKTACDLWTAAFFASPRPSPSQMERESNGMKRMQPVPPVPALGQSVEPEREVHKTQPAVSLSISSGEGWGEASLVPTTDTVRQYLATPKAARAQMVGEALALSERLRFFHWPLEFPDVFERGGFDVVLGNPPWERIKLQEQEFFAGRDPEIATASNKAARERLLKTLPQRRPALAAEWDAAKHDAEAQSKFVRGSGRFPLCGRGDVNTYSVFAETMRGLLCPTGRSGCIVPSGIATDDTTKLFFQSLMDSRSLVSLYSFFEIRALFPGTDSRNPFCLLTLTGSERPAASGVDFAFFLLNTRDLHEAERRFTLSASDMALLNPNTRTCPIFRSRHDAELTKAIYRRVPVLIKEGPPEENPWGIRFATMFHMSNDSGLFRTREQLEAEGWSLGGNVFRRGSDRYLPLYEGRLGHQFNHRFASQPRGQLSETSYVDLIDPTYQVEPQYWMPATETYKRLSRRSAGCVTALIGFRRVTRSTDERTVIATALPWGAASNGWILALGPGPDPLLLLLAHFNAFVFDYIARTALSQPSMPQGTFEQFPIPLPAIYDDPCPWSSDERLAEWIAPRVLELTYTAWDLQPFGRDLGYDGPPFCWDEERRFLLRCELDAAFFHLYGIGRDDVDYIMESFPIVKRRDEVAHGEYRTKRVILEIYHEIRQAMASGEPYQTRLSPPPADPRVTHGGETRESEPAVIAATARPERRAAEEPEVYAAEPDDAPKATARPVTGPERYRQAAVLAWLAASSAGDPAFGRLKLVKELYFTQEHLGVDLRLDFVREAAGPLDPKIYAVEGLAAKQNWLRVSGRRGEAASYRPGPDVGRASQVAQSALQGRWQEVEELRRFFRPFNSLKMEQWATVHQVWRDRRDRGQPLAEDAIVVDVRAWKADKIGFDEPAVRRTVAEMAKASFIHMDA